MFILGCVFRGNHQRQRGLRSTGASMGIDVFMANYYRVRNCTPNCHALVWYGRYQTLPGKWPRSNNARSNFRGLIYGAYCSLVANGISGINVRENVLRLIQHLELQLQELSLRLISKLPSLLPWLSRTSVYLYPVWSAVEDRRRPQLCLIWMTFLGRGNTAQRTTQSAAESVNSWFCF